LRATHPVVIIEASAKCAMADRAIGRGFRAAGYRTMEDAPPMTQPSDDPDGHRLPGQSGVEGIRTLCERYAQIPVVA
jgi:hypothetical protein